MMDPVSIRKREINSNPSREATNSRHGGRPCKPWPIARSRRGSDQNKKRAIGSRKRRPKDRPQRNGRELADRQAAEELQRQQQSGNDCDRLAATPSDIRRKSEGVGFTVLKGQADQAIEACGKAVQQSPNELRYRYQLARAYQFKDTNKAFTLFSQLVETEYPAAFDNLGGMYRDRNNHQKALQLYLRGAGFRNADSMVALADLIDKNFYTPDNPVAMKLALLKRAAELGHAGAPEGIPDRTSQGSTGAGRTGKINAR